jgi:acetoin utilization protein AcuB
MSAHQIAQEVVKSPYVIHAHQDITEAWDYMKKCQIRHLPVYRGDEIVGIISDRDLRSVTALKSKYKLLVEDVMKTDVYLVERHTPIRKVAQYMADHKIGSALIVDQKEHLIGIFTTSDALYLLAHILEDSERSGLVLSDEDYWPRGFLESV